MESRNVLNSPMEDTLPKEATGSSSGTGSPIKLESPFEDMAGSTAFGKSGICDHNPTIPMDKPHSMGPNTIALKFFESVTGSPLSIESPMENDESLNKVA